MLGHGSGKLFTEDAMGRLNFSRETVDPVTGKRVEGWYRDGESFSGKFGKIAVSFEECRAEVVALVLCVEKDILRIFGVDESDMDDMIYAIYLDMARMGLNALEQYDPKIQKWRQPHSQARFTILLLLLQSTTLKLTPTPPTLTLDRKLLQTQALPILRSTLLQLQVHRSTGNAVDGVRWYSEMSAVPTELLGVREEVVRGKTARRVVVQGNTFERGVGKGVEFVEYAASVEGFLRSFVERDVVRW
ncbi:bifunctional diacylglycerol diphosphate phosphatase/phosphatidate phosphatase [Dinochytrium kinnereticum]|nr:bifunctional diacylglycerol diphosphate phosphatase/phosphatidate phosphatase [Dinochytrium kinnereticum]